MTDSIFQPIPVPEVKEIEMTVEEWELLRAEWLFSNGGH